MPNELPPLAEADCRLLPAGELPLVGRYNAAAAQLAELRAEAAGLSGFPETIAKIESDLGTVRTKLTRQHYRVGFLGTTGAGKSTTFNNILKVSEEDAPARSGGGSATTAAPARLRRSAAGKPDVKLNFMSDAEYLRRKNRLAEHLKLGELLTEDDLLAKCEELRVRLENREILEAQLPDVIALESLIQSRRKYPALVPTGTHRQSRPGHYADRSSYLNHPFDPNQKRVIPTPSENRLLWEVAIEFPNDFLPVTLEMIDLPGLGATSYHDTCVTLDIIENKGAEGLDGAMLFIRSEQLSDDSVVQIIQKLQGAWGKRFQGRVWAVFTKFDALAKEHYVNNPNFFSSVDKLLRDSDIPVDCAFVVSNEVARMIEPGMDEPRRCDIAGIKLSRKHDDPVLTKHFAAYPYFEKIVREVYLNGGLDYLRTAIVERLGEMIGREVADDAKTLLGQVERDVEQALRTAKRRKTQTSQDQERATECARALHRVIREVRQGLPEFKTATVKIRDGMQATVKKHALVDDLAEMAADDIPSSFRTIANQLDKATQNLLVNHGVEPIYGKIQGALKDLPPIPLGGAETIQQAWANSIQTDTETENWRSDVPRFEQRDLIEQMCGAADRLQGAQFKALLENKIHAVTLVTMFRVRERLMNRLNALSNELKLLVTQQ